MFFSAVSLHLLASVSIYAVGTIAASISPRAVPILPSDDPFYQMPAGAAAAEPGTILRHRKPPSPIAAFGLDKVNLKDTYQILYRTTDALKNATATVLTVLVPHNADYTKVLSYQVAEDAASINCGPSYALQLHSATSGPFGTIVTQAELLLVEAALSQGWVVILPDHEGPKGSYLANYLAGYATLDGIRAAINSANFTGISKTPTVAMWGYSGGSIASGWAAELQPEYAPELKIAGAALGGTVPNLTSAIFTLNKGPLAGLIPVGVQGLSFQYPEVRAVVEKNLKPQYTELFGRVSKQCFVADVADFLFADVIGMVEDPSIFTTPPASTVLEENGMGKRTPGIPLYIYKSFFDQVSPVSDTNDLVDAYCAAGATVNYVRDLLSEHGSLAAVGAPRALAWLIDVMNGKEPKKGCSTDNVISSLLDESTLEIVPKYLLDALQALLGGPVGPSFFG